MLGRRETLTQNYTFRRQLGDIWETLGRHLGEVLEILEDGHKAVSGVNCGVCARKTWRKKGSLLEYVELLSLFSRQTIGRQLWEVSTVAISTTQLYHWALFKQSLKYGSLVLLNQTSEIESIHVGIVYGFLRSGVKDYLTYRLPLETEGGVGGRGEGGQVHQPIEPWRPEYLWRVCTTPGPDLYVVDWEVVFISVLQSVRIDQSYRFIANNNPSY